MLTTEGMLSVMHRKGDGLPCTSKRKAVYQSLIENGTREIVGGFGKFAGASGRAESVAYRETGVFVLNGMVTQPNQ